MSHPMGYRHDSANIAYFHLLFTINRQSAIFQKNKATQFSEVLLPISELIANRNFDGKI